MKTELIEVDEYLVFVHSVETENENLILEAKVKGTSLIGNYSYKKHQPHNPTGQYHLHVYKKENEILSINKDGSGHDGYSGTHIPNKVYHALKNKFNDWDFPSNQIIENLQIKNYKMDIKNNLRKVRVSAHKDFDSNEVQSFDGHFHTFADSPFLTGGTGGWFSRTVAIIEDENGYVRKVPIGYFRFIVE
ncbi:hypothetical protein CXF68_14985 [Tenacibaculum sp. Bg11-29]|uniref:hypothetical protein n=1 Tax=Tenacibaculum sp. Bg11-29 TaxID=2058306 RepID=UPI000C31F3FA|nr:hypothetical protein [Tenacibaculum sp. Bg11-29]PKH51912.1 hypothetical protein CXF68_14985 [Tenacibaculum sp. Bg11-29]